MSKYFKNYDGDYIFSIGEGIGDTEITQEEYEHILSAIRSRPTAEPGYMYKLRTDLTWEAYDLPPEPEPSDEDELSDAEALDILLGGEV